MMSAVKRVCPECNGTRFISCAPLNMSSSGSAAIGTRICDYCNGRGMIDVQEPFSGAERAKKDLGCLGRELERERKRAEERAKLLRKAKINAIKTRFGRKLVRVRN